jgi:hypothetical protein
VKHAFVPFYKNITIESMLEFAKQYEEVWKYLPEERDIGNLPRQWITDILASVIGKPFQDWVEEKIKERNRYVMEKGNL